MAGTPEEELNRLNSAIRETIGLLRELKAASIESRGGVASEKEVAESERLNNLIRERNALLRQAKTGTTVSGGFKEGDTPYKPRPNLASIDTRTEEQKRRELASAQKAADAEAKRAAKKAQQAAEEERLANIRNKFETEAIYENARRQAQARGFTSANLQSIEDRGGDVQRLKMQRFSGGVNQQFNPYVNMKTGASTPGLSSQFRTFGSDILRDIGQFTKWSIAIAAVYTPLQKLGELMTIMIDNESRLADATIAANIPFNKSGELFDTVATSAERAGEGINTTIDAYAQAIRAAGRYNDEATKQVAAVKLLDDALILSKLSTLDQSESIDTLSAALLQSDRSLIQGEELLNKWVKVSQIANVSIDGLATGVAVLGDSAETVGLSIDQLNGLIAVLSEQSISGAKEAANTAKALVGAYQSDKAEAALNKYGIALRKANGEVRGFLEIYQELNQLRQQGILSESAVSEVALALGGGGVRRAKDASALINSTERLNKIAQESAKITGSDALAQEALAKKLETVQTANTRLANSFQELAQTLGTDGGLLDSFKGIINGLTAITKGADELFTLLGRSGPILTSFVTGLIALSAVSSGTKGVMLSRLGAQFFKGGQFMPSAGPLYGQGRAPAGGAYGVQGGLGFGRAASDIIQMNYRGAGLVAGAGVALQAGSNLAAGRNENAVGNLVGGAAGAAIGAALGGPIGLAAGANIGSAVGDAFVTAVGQHSQELADYFLPPTKVGAETSAAGLRGKTTQELIDTAYNSLNYFQKIGAYLSTRETKQTSGGLFGGTFEKYTKESAVMDIIKRQNPALYAELFKQFTAQQAQLNAQTAVSGAGVGTDKGLIEERKRIEQQATEARKYQLGQLAQGKITTAEFGRISSQLTGVPSVATKSVSAFGDEITKVSRDIQNTTEAYDAFLYIAQYGTQDQINLISSYSDDILKLQTYLKELNQNPALIGAELDLSWGKIKIESPEQLGKLISEAQKQGATNLGITLQQVQASQAQAVKLSPLVGDYNKPLTGKSQDIVVSRGLEIQQKYLVETGKTADEIAKFKAGIEAFYTTVDRGLGANFEAVNGLTQQFYDLGKAAAEAAGELENVNNPIGFQKFDIPMAQLSQLAAQSLGIGQSWQKKFNYDFKPEDQIAIDNQGIVQPLHADFKILALLLESLNDKAQKQLDGQYNIPEGATFWVPLTAAYYRNKSGTGGSDLANTLANLDLGDNTSATDQNTQALRELTAKYESSDFKIREQQGGLPYVDQNKMKEQQYQNLLRDNGRGLPSQNTVKNQQYQQLMREYGGEILPEYRKSTVQQTQSQGLLQELKNFFQNLFSQPINPGYGGHGGAGMPPQSSGVSGQNTNVNTTPTTKLDLKVSSNINLLVDGRILASTLQSYLASELLKTESSQGTITKRFVI